VSLSESTKDGRFLFLYLLFLFIWGWLMADVFKLPEMKMNSEELSRVSPLAKALVFVWLLVPPWIAARFVSVRWARRRKPSE